MLRWNLIASYDTPLEVLEELHGRMNAYVAANNREWSGCALIDKMTYHNAIYLTIAMERECPSPRIRHITSGLMRVQTARIGKIWGAARRSCAIDDP